MAHSYTIQLVARPSRHWTLAYSEMSKRPELGFSVRLDCEGVVRRLYVRRSSRESGAQAFEGIGYICEGCGELHLDRSWQSNRSVRAVD
jgi:hypothetical protein